MLDDDNTQRRGEAGGEAVSEVFVNTNFRFVTNTQTDVKQG